MSKELAKENKTVILFDYPWNREKGEDDNIQTHENIVRMSIWEEIKESIKYIAEERLKRVEARDPEALAS